MTVADLPGIPVQLAALPTIGGLVVPWTTGRTPDGRYRFGTVDLDRHNRALVERLLPDLRHATAGPDRVRPA